jgi:predicted CXXCH cytochrome family protein
MRALAALLALTGISAGAVSLKTAVIGSKHDLTATGSGDIKSAQTDSCIFCHAPHNIQPNVTPLWDQTLSSQSYVTYTSSTYTSGAQTPSADSSKLCLSCHDGTVAVGLTVTRGQIATTGSMATADVLGTNLANSHPGSMTPADDGSLASTLFGSTPATKDPAVLLVGGKVECTTCHDPHNPRNDPAVPMFLSRSNANAALCLACHDPTRSQPNFLNGWTTSSHAIAANTVPTTSGLGGYGAVGTNACSSCHGAHNNPVAPRNEKGLEEAACSPCHSGTNVTPALLNITAEFTKTYAHPTMTVSGAHDPAESLPVNTTRHAECADCHNPHTAYAQTGTALPPTIQASMSGVSGYDTTGPQKPASKEYQVCYKCHADSTNKPLTSTYGRTASRYPIGPLPTGNIVTPMPPDQYNVRLKFLSTISHNVAGSSVPTTTVASLLPYMLDVNNASILTRPLTRTSQIYCTDCHNNNQARSSNGTGPNGPHGSTFPHLLALNLSQDSAGGGGGTTAYNLCVRCHSLTTLRNESVHNDHVGGDGNTGCTTCHDPHGVIGGNAVSNLAMMNLDTAVATKASGATYYGFYYSGGRIGCYLTCHGENHNPHSYTYP